MRTFCALALLALVAGTPVYAARPLLDHHQWDKYFALFARDVNVPWRPALVRLDTYSGAAVDFSAYNVDPAEVIVAGAQQTARALDTRRRKPLLRWRFVPPRGYRFEASDVGVPLAAQEGFYVVQAQRGDAVQQVWLNRTHIGLLAEDSPEGVVFWAVNLRNGRALAHAPFSVLVGRQLLDRRTDADGLVVWRDARRPTFALVQDGAGRAFLSLLPQAPVPGTIVGIRLASPVVRAGGRIRFVGFARKRISGSYRRASGTARIVLASHGVTVAGGVVHLDAAGAFAGELAVPAGADAGDDAVIASTAGAVGGTSVHVDSAGDVALAVRSLCPCDPQRDVPVEILARRQAFPAAGIAVRVLIVRSPHVAAPGASRFEPLWGTTVVYDRTVYSDADGVARVIIASPSDGLDSTYAVSASTRGASATSTIVVPSAPVALSLTALAPTADVGAPVAFDLRGFDPIDGSPAAALFVHVALSHGANAQTQNVRLDAQGRRRVVFRRTNLGSNLALASAEVSGRTALDAASVLVEPSALSSGAAQDAGPGATVTLDRRRYRPGDRVGVVANVAGCTGDALISLTGVRTYALRRVAVSAGRAQTTLPMPDAQGDVRVDAACVREGAIVTADAPVALVAPGHAVAVDVALDRTSYAPGDVAHVELRGGAADRSTVAIRIADAAQSGGAYFGDAADVLAAGATSTQTPSSEDPQWHAYVAPAGSKASDIFAADRARKVGVDLPLIGAALARTLYWRVVPDNAGAIDVPVPVQRGHYVLSVLRIAADGDVGAASSSLTVR